MKIKKGVFIAGTDTHVGKTFFACQLLKTLSSHGYKTVGLKPVASGGVITPDGFQNEDTQLLRLYATEKLSYSHLNPFCFIPPIAPSLAARKTNLELNVKNILSACGTALLTSADYIVIEGAGGWLVPLNKTETMADLAIALGYPAILVVAIRLGCINHALLSADSIQRSGLSFAGWVANCMDADMNTEHQNDIIEAIQERLGSPLKQPY